MTGPLSVTLHLNSKLYLDYITHEMIHLLHLNHSADYLRHGSALIPLTILGIAHTGPGVIGHEG